MKQWLFIAAIAAYFGSVFYPGEAFQWIVSALSLLIVIVVFRSVKSFVKGMGAAFLGIGIVLLAASGAPWASYIRGFGNMLNILSLFALLPLIAIPIELGGYALRIQTVIQSKIKHSGLLYTITSGLSYILSTFMNLATLPMMYHAIRPSLDLYPIEQKERFISRAITHGYSMPIVWTPVAPIVGIVVEMTGVQWSSILPIVIPFSLLGLALDSFMGRSIANRRLKLLGQAALDKIAAAREHSATEGKRQSGGHQASHPGQIIIAIVAFNGLIMLLEALTRASFLLLVAVSVIPFAFLWSLLIGKGRQFFVQSRAVLPDHLFKMKEQFFVFLSAGFMISAIQASGAGHIVNAGIMAVKDAVGADLFVLLIPLIPLTLAFVGLHPAVALALAAESLNPQALGLSVGLTAIAMLTGAAAAFMVGPYNATAGMMAALSGQSSYKISNWNLPYTAAYLAMAMALLLILKKAG
ncbi:hypothetical protein [Paenibacillus naphthalenovorans]|uniref:hypothetical protein n=1 Tax=Paenibacillus naphthalenovorans TaxID=162209 RepID=UPI00088D4137|nr:hypothetical protein [Paenibacillus naphthalenovorans]SDJ78085.1 hypothetical protein SAMN05421868_14414 [Paenibacillus naphthalenovorans]